MAEAPTITRAAFLAAYRRELAATYTWAQDEVKLERFLSSVREALDGGHSWTPSGQTLAASAWQALGGKGKPSLTRLRELAP